MDIKVYFTSKSNYIPNGSEIYTNVKNLNFDPDFGLEFSADFHTFPISTKKYRFKIWEIKNFNMGDFSKEIYEMENYVRVK